MSDREAKIVSAMAWVRDADPIRDAETSLSSDEPPVLIAFSLRKMVVPGLTEEEYEAIADQVSERFPEGMSDVVLGEAHMEMRRELRDYAELYNRAIYEALTEER
ncbi:MAG: hypothetical protein AAF311_03110 [Pseudomonadota bacterium]